MTNEAFIKGQLALMAYRKGYDAGGTDCMMAFMLIARNRVTAGWGDWLTVIKGMYELGDEGFPNLSDVAFRTILQSVDMVFEGTMPDKLTEGALYWHEFPDDGIPVSEVKSLQYNPIPCAKVAQVSMFK